MECRVGERYRVLSEQEAIGVELHYDEEIGCFVCEMNDGNYLCLSEEDYGMLGCEVVITGESHVRGCVKVMTDEKYATEYPEILLAPLERVCDMFVANDISFII